MAQEQKNIRVFGYGLSVVASLIATRLGGVYPNVIIVYGVLIALSILLVVVTTYAWRLLAPIYRIWMKVAHAIGTVMTALILSVIFYLVFGVIGIILRLLKKDMLEQRSDSTTTTYWHRREIVFDKKRYTQQF